MDFVAMLEQHDSTTHACMHMYCFTSLYYKWHRSIMCCSLRILNQHDSTIHACMHMYCFTSLYYKWH